MKMTKTGTGMTNRRTMRTNDGESVPIGKDAPVATGPIGASYANDAAFERYRKGGAPVNGAIGGMQSQEKGVNLDDPGFDASGSCFVKNGTPFGEAAMFNQLPPGPDISDQKYALINGMPMRTYGGGTSFPGDTPWPSRDIEE